MSASIQELFNISDQLAKNLEIWSLQLANHTETVLFLSIHHRITIPKFHLFLD